MAVNSQYPWSLYSSFVVLFLLTKDSNHFNFKRILDLEVEGILVTLYYIYMNVILVAF